ncbi:MAG TPA: serine protease, partial [Rhodocyclaceae bacterium]|nr:serine protease [Rhodocyclaceae bacterium]
VTKVEKYARLEGEDACLLYAPGAGGEVIEWGNSSELKTGDIVYTFGHPGGSTDLIWSEAQFMEHVSIGGNPYLKTANYCRPGSSGGPLLDASGRLVGIVTMVQVRDRGGERSYGA